MKIKRIVEYGVENQEKLVAAVIDEFWRKIWDLYCRIGNPKLRQCFITVQLDQDTRVPISNITEVKTDPEVLDDEYDPDVWKRRRGQIHYYLDYPDGRKQIVQAFESGARSLTLSMKEVPTFEDHTEWSVQLGHQDVNGERLLWGLR
jgi:hypothetical protein